MISDRTPHKGHSSFSPWQRHGIDPLKNRKLYKERPTPHPLDGPGLFPGDVCQLQQQRCFQAVHHAAQRCR
jgi:hypothetical protein